VREWYDTEDLIIQMCDDERAAIVLDRDIEEIRKRRKLIEKGKAKTVPGKHLCWNCLQPIDEKRDSYSSATYFGGRIFWHTSCPGNKNTHFLRVSAVMKQYQSRYYAESIKNKQKEVSDVCEVIT